MNKRAIWMIIGLMSLSVLGVIWMQADLIRTAIRENERAFDKNVISVLNKVVVGLEKEEKQNNLNAYESGFMRQRFGQREMGGPISQQLYRLLTDISELDQPERLRLADIMQGETSPEEEQQLADLPRRLSLSALSLNVSNSFNPLERRINSQYLDAALRQELDNIGINTKVRYAIYSRERDDIIYADGNWRYLSDGQRQTSPLQNNQPSDQLYLNSDYSVHLFPQESPSPGKLLLYFPDKQRVLWRDIWQYFLGLTVLMTVILLCFAYTIQVIFRQKKVSEMKTDFINNMTHEFKTPIATISLAADSITSPRVSGDPQKVDRLAKIIKQENKRMNNQVEKVLQMALLDRQDFNLNISAVNLHEIIERAVENMSLQVEQKDGDVYAELTATRPVVQADLTHVQNIINNLLDNANKYTPDQPEIVVYTRDVQNGVEVVVQDNGVGMTKEERKHIFDKFYRVHTGNLHDVKGFGLGLSYVKVMMDAHHGRISVKSESGKGSSFILYFPHQMPAE